MHRQIFFILLLFSCSSNAQGTFEKEFKGEYKLAEIFDGNFEMYVSDCGNILLSKAAANFMISQRNIFKKDLDLSSVVDSELICVHMKDSVLLKKLYSSLLNEEKLTNKICLIYSNKYKVDTCLFYAVVFSKKGYRNYNKKRSKTKYSFDDVPGKQIIKNGVDISKYANGYITILKDDSLVSYKVPIK